MPTELKFWIFIPKFNTVFDSDSEAEEEMTSSPRFLNVDLNMENNT